MKTRKCRSWPERSLEIPKVFLWNPSSAVCWITIFQMRWCRFRGWEIDCERRRLSQALLHLHEVFQTPGLSDRHDLYRRQHLLQGLLQGRPRPGQATSHDRPSCHSSGRGKGRVPKVLRKGQILYKRLHEFRLQISPSKIRPPIVPLIIRFFINFAKISGYLIGGGHLIG